MNFLRRRGKRHQLAARTGGVPCERCGEPTRDRFAGSIAGDLEADDVLKDSEAAGIIAESCEDHFADLYPRALSLCASCRAAHFLWLASRREWLSPAPGTPVGWLLGEAASNGILADATKLYGQLVGTPSQATGVELLALADTHVTVPDLAARVLTRRSWDQLGPWIREQSDWIGTRLPRLYERWRRNLGPRQERLSSKP